MGAYVLEVRKENTFFSGKLNLHLQKTATRWEFGFMYTAKLYKEFLKNVCDVNFVLLAEIHTQRMP